MMYQVIVQRLQLRLIETVDTNPTGTFKNMITVKMYVHADHWFWFCLVVKMLTDCWYYGCYPVDIMMVVAVLLSEKMNKHKREENCRQLLCRLHLRLQVFIEGSNNVCFPLSVSLPHLLISPAAGPKAIFLCQSASLPPSTYFSLICCQMKCIYAPMVEKRGTKKWTDVETDGW